MRARTHTSHAQARKHNKNKNTPLCFATHVIHNHQTTSIPYACVCVCVRECVHKPNVSTRVCVHVCLFPPWAECVSGCSGRHEAPVTSAQTPPIRGRLRHLPFDAHQMQTRDETCGTQHPPSSTPIYLKPNPRALGPQSRFETRPGSRMQQRWPHLNRGLLVEGCRGFGLFGRPQRTGRG